MTLLHQEMRSGGGRQALRIDVGSPGETLEAALAFFRRAIASGIRLDAIGIASFGPLEFRAGNPRYGSITTTPKPGWSSTDVVGPFVAAFGRRGPRSAVSSAAILACQSTSRLPSSFRLSSAARRARQERSFSQSRPLRHSTRPKAVAPHATPPGRRGVGWLDR